jgi:hypothetical protein
LDLEDFIGGPVAVTNSKYATKVEPKAKAAAGKAGFKTEQAVKPEVASAVNVLKRSAEAIEPAPQATKKVAKRRFVIN